MIDLRHLFLFLSILLSAIALAGPVSKTEALRKAQQFMPAKQFSELPSQARFRTSGEADAFYIFNAEHDGGFVIVSADDRTVPILGYSDSGTLSEDNMPDNLRAWLASYAAQIEAIAKGTETVAETPSQAFMPPIAPMIKTEWSQTFPFDKMCPTYEWDGETFNYPNGCVPTAVAQVMYYWQWPEESPAIPGYTTSTDRVALQELPPTTFKWEKMQTVYRGTNQGEAQDAVAELMRYVGQALNTNYTVSGSSTYVNIDKLSEYFGYSSQAYSVGRSHYTASEWEHLIYHELAQGRPVLYGGNPEDSYGNGHEFICDGYDGKGLYHINWGWGMGRNGYYVLSLANPSGSPTNIDMNKKGYSRSQSAVIGFQPAKGNEAFLPLLSLSTNVADQEYQRESADEDFKDVSLVESRPRSYFEKNMKLVCNIEVGWALYQNGNLIKTLDSGTLIYNTTTSGVIGAGTSVIFAGVLPETLSFGAGLPDGKYELRMVSRLEGTEDWTPWTGQEYFVARIAGNTLSLGLPDMAATTYTVSDISYDGEMAAGKQVTAKVSVMNDCDNPKKDLYFWLKTNDQWKLVAYSFCRVDPGRQCEVPLTFTPDAAGIFEVRVTSDSDGEQVMGTSEITLCELFEQSYDQVLYICNPIKKTASAKVSSRTESITIHSSVTADDGVTYEVKKVEDKGFMTTGTIKTVTIEPGIEEIGMEAFFDTYMETIELPATVKRFGFRAIAENTRLASVIVRATEPPAISKDVFEITKTVDGNPGWILFSDATLYVPAGCKETYLQAEGWKEFANIVEGELKTVTINGMKYSYITGEDETTLTDGRDRANDIGTLTIPSSISIDGITYNVTTIADNAFRNAFMLEKVVIPEGVKSIGNDAFSLCYSLTDVELPSTIEHIGSKAFYGNSTLMKVISNIEVPSDIDNSVFDCGGSTPNAVYDNATLYVPKGATSAYQSAGGWKNFKKICGMETTTAVINGITYSHTVGKDYVTIVASDAEALSGKDVTIPEQVTIEWKLYDVTSITEEAFKDVQMKSVTIGAGIKSIEARAFYNCKTLTKVFSNIAMPFSINPNVFSYSETIDGESHESFTDAVLYVPEGCSGAYASAEGWKEFRQISESVAKSIVIDDITYSYTTGKGIATLVSGDKEALDGKDVTIPSAITVDGEDYRVTSIARRAFQKVPIRSVTIESGIESIGANAFWNCYRLNRIVIPEGVKSIGDEAFRYCYYIREIELPSTLGSIGYMAFNNIIYATKIVSHIAKPFYVSKETFTNNKNVDGESVEVFSEATLFVPKGTKARYESTDCWKSFQNIVEILPGDMNSNGQFDAADVVAIMGVIAGKGDDNARILADVNDDGVVNIADVMVVVNAILGKNSETE